MLDLSVYLLYRAGSLVIRAIPLRVIFAIGSTLGFAAWLLSTRYRRLAQHNLAIAFAGEKTPSALRRLTRQHFQRLGANLLSSIKLGTMPLEQVAERVVLENEDLVHHALRGGTPVIIALSHLGNWELVAQLFPRYFGSVRNGTVYQQLGNRHIDADVRQ